MKKTEKEKRATGDFARKLRAVGEMKKARTEFVRRIGKIMKNYDLFFPGDDDDPATMLKNDCRYVADAAYSPLEHTESMWSLKLRDRMFAKYDLATRPEMKKLREGLRDE